MRSWRVAEIDFRARPSARLGTTLRQMGVDGTEDFYILAAVRLLAYCGLRRGEVLGLEWRDVDLERGRLELREAKTETRVAIINVPMQQILKDLIARRDAAITRATARRKGSREDSPSIIPARTHGRPVRGIHEVWGRIRDRAELLDVALHDLRHCFASKGAVNGLWLVMNGGLLGHRSPQTTSRWIDWADAPQRGASDQVAHRIGAAIAPAQRLPDNVRPRRRWAHFVPIFKSSRFASIAPHAWNQLDGCGRLEGAPPAGWLGVADSAGFGRVRWVSLWACGRPGL